MSLQILENYIYSVTVNLNVSFICHRRRGIWKKHDSKANEVGTNLKSLYRLVYNLVTRSVYKTKSNVFMVCLVFASTILESSMTMAFLQRTTVNTSPSFLAMQFTLC